MSDVRPPPLPAAGVGRTWAERTPGWVFALTPPLSASLISVGFFYGISISKWEKFDGGIKEVRQIALQADEKAEEAKAAVAEQAKQHARDLNGLKISFGRSLNKAIKPLTIAQYENARATGELTVAFKGFEGEVRRALERIRDWGSTP